MFSDELTDRANVDLAFEVQSDLAETREPQFELGVEIKPAGSLDAPGLDFAVRERRVITLLTCQALDVDRGGACW
jgi:hypothetical protein